MTELAKEYGAGMYALAAEENIAKDVLAEMRMLRNCFKEQPEFVKLLSNMALQKEERLSILDSTLRGQVHPYLLNFLKILCERGALSEFAGCEEAYRELYNKDHGVVEAHVTTGAALSDDQRARLIEKLRQMTNQEIVLLEKVDPKVVGGVLLEMNGQRYDNTVRHRLESVRRAMVGEA